MSAFLVEEKTIHKIIYAIAHEMKRSDRLQRSNAKKS